MLNRIVLQSFVNNRGTYYESDMNGNAIIKENKLENYIELTFAFFEISASKCKVTFIVGGAVVAKTRKI